ncbi:MAG TPA: hypothetical protein VK745_01320 [Polyangiaceae bacterium]|nr:hypothetical protein [Polyangiaceae bacterium]
MLKRVDRAAACPRGSRAAGAISHQARSELHGLAARERRLTVEKALADLERFGRLRCDFEGLLACAFGLIRAGKTGCFVDVSAVANEQMIFVCGALCFLEAGQRVFAFLRLTVLNQNWALLLFALLALLWSARRCGYAWSDGGSRVRGSARLIRAVLTRWTGEKDDRANTNAQRRQSANLQYLRTVHASSPIGCFLAVTETLFSVQAAGGRHITAY